MQLLLIFRCGLLHGCKFLLEFTILRKRRSSGRKDQSANDHQAFADRNDRASNGMFLALKCKATIH
jgi:hypothetical protein